VEPETEERALRIGIACPNCLCEEFTVGPHGSPGRVESTETLHSILIAPADYEKESIKYTLISHAEKKGMSVMRGGSSNEEILAIIKARVTTPERYLHGIASFACASIRAIAATQEDELRAAGERYFSVLDTDMPDVPNHADVFATVPSKGEPKFNKTEFKKVRQKMLAIMSQTITPPADFREGTFAEYSSAKLATG
jgi:hypothetical protein